MHKTKLKMISIKNCIRKNQYFYPNAFILCFLTVTFVQFFATKKELYPFSPFGMYQNAFSPKNLQEYDLRSTSNPSEDQLLKFDHIRFYLKYRLQRIPYSSSESYRKMIEQELRRCFEKESMDFKLYTFTIKHWDFFEAQRYHQPDRLITIHFEDIFP